MPRRAERFHSDVDSVHVYFKPIRLQVGERPLILSEFGGYSYRIADHAYNLRKNYGYRTLRSQNELTEALSALYLGEVLPAIREGLSCAVYTQLSDVEDETNGLVTYDRRRVKVDVSRMREISSALFTAFLESLALDL